MELKIGDRLVDETGEWEVVGRPYTTAGGKNARVRVQRIGEPGSHHLRTWGAHERISVKRTTAEGGQAMIQLRRTSLLVALSLFTSAAAHADGICECVGYCLYESPDFRITVLDGETGFALSDVHALAAWAART